MIQGKDVDHRINKLFVMYDDYEKSYEKEWGPSLTDSVYGAMNKNIEIRSVLHLFCNHV